MSSTFKQCFSRKIGKSYAVHYKSRRHILDCPASGDLCASELINKHLSILFIAIVLLELISEASKYHVCKFYQIALNSLQAIQFVHKLSDCPSYSFEYFQTTHTLLVKFCCHRYIFDCYNNYIIVYVFVFISCKPFVNIKHYDYKSSDRQVLQTDRFE